MDALKREKFWSDVRLGLLTFFAMFFVVLGVTFAGGEKGLFMQKTEFLHACLGDVGGLKKGSSVTMAGMAIGKVTDIRFGNETAQPIEVEMEIRSDVRQRIKADSVPAVRTQGMLGDRYVDISAGTAEAGPLEAGKMLAGNGATDFDKTLQNANSALQETAKMISAINSKEGTFGQLFYDEQLYTKMLEISTHLNSLLEDFKKNPKRYVNLEIF